MIGRDHLRQAVLKARNPNTSPDELVECLQVIAGYTYQCAEEEAKAHAAYLDAERHRKYEFAQAKLTAMTKGNTATKAEAIAETMTAGWRTAEVRAQATRLELKAMLDGARDVMDALRTRVSWLKWERTNANTQT